MYIEGRRGGVGREQVQEKESQSESKSKRKSNNGLRRLRAEGRAPDRMNSRETRERA